MGEGWTIALQRDFRVEDGPDLGAAKQFLDTLDNLGQRQVLIDVEGGEEVEGVVRKRHP